MARNNPPEWMVSLHGGHSGAYCDHASGSLRETLDAAVAAEYDTFGVSEHAPRLGDHLLYEDEVAMGWDVSRLETNFAAYGNDLAPLVEAFRDRLTVLRGFETETVPAGRYVDIMLGLREHFDFEYIVGSVHHVDEILLDGPPAHFAEALEARGGLENLTVAYYGAVAEMVRALKPEVVAHVDLIRKNAPSNESVQTPRGRRAAEEALEVIREHGCILDCNTAGYRKGLGSPYPASWLVKAAHDMGIPFCFGDDSHAPSEVGRGIHDARDYLLANGVDSVTVLTKDLGMLIQKTVPLGT